jgi:hypothetical protein
MTPAQSPVLLQNISNVLAGGERRNSSNPRPSTHPNTLNMDHRLRSTNQHSIKEHDSPSCCLLTPLLDPLFISPWSCCCWHCSCQRCRWYQPLEHLSRAHAGRRSGGRSALCRLPGRTDTSRCFFFVAYMKQIQCERRRQALTRTHRSLDLTDRPPVVVFACPP